MSDIAVSVQNLSKLYRIGGEHQGYRTLRDSLGDSFTGPLNKIKSLLSNKVYGASGLEEIFWALRDVSLDVKRGEILGIIGRNGAGKSTILKILSRITEPTEGYVDVFGRVGALLEVGTGFHPELTGRENIYLNGSILGMSRREIDFKFDEIVDFAGVEKFIDTPVKHYSSGMGLRLGFAVAAHLEPEILIIDEVLAVGDAEFQKKCLNKMGDVAQTGKTVIFVSHNMGAIEGLCERVVWLDKGQIIADEKPEVVVGEYLTATASGYFFSQDTGRLQLKRVMLKDCNGKETTTFAPGDDIQVSVSFFAAERIPKPHFWIGIYSRHGGVCGANMLLDGRSPDYIEGEGTITCHFRAVPLLSQSYTIKMGCRDAGQRQYLISPQEIAFFNVSGKLSDYGLYADQADMMARGSIPLVHPYEWHFDNGSSVSVQIIPKKIGC